MAPRSERLGRAVQAQTVELEILDANPTPPEQKLLGSEHVAIEVAAAPETLGATQMPDGPLLVARAQAVMDQAAVGGDPRLVPNDLDHGCVRIRVIIRQSSTSPRRCRRFGGPRSHL